MQSCGVHRPSVRLSVSLSVCKHFAQIASSTRQMAGSRPNLHTMVPSRASIQGVLKVKVEVKSHVILSLCPSVNILRKSLLLPDKWLDCDQILHIMVPRRACIQDVLKVKVEVKGHVIRAL